MTNGDIASKLDLTDGALPAVPGIAALFLVKFDHRKGYVLAWHKALDGVQVEDAVEFKSLPSGLHNIQQDLVYFVQDQYAGISAYINRPDETSERNASMLAVGVLVLLEHGRIGKGWLHAEGLESLSRQCMDSPSDNGPLEQYWDEHRLDDSYEVDVHTPRSPEASTDSLNISKTRDSNTNGYQGHRSMSTTSVGIVGSHAFTPHHPAARLMETLQLFGPLLFPLYRAALLRKRILLISEAPIELACNIVYNLSILASFPRSLSDYVNAPRSARRSSQPLFNVGVHDIPKLADMKGWIACTTDDVLASKPELFDVVVFLPGMNAKQASRKKYPKILLSSPELLKTFPKHGARGTQRDAIRYQTLMRRLKKFPASTITNPEPTQIPMPPEGPAEDAASVLSSSTIELRKEVVESPSWGQVAYTSLLWWASAGARRDGLSEEEQDEQDQDEQLLGAEGDEDLTKEVAMIGYFRRLTGVMVSVVSQLVGRTDDDEDEDDEPLEDGSDDQQPLRAEADDDEVVEVTPEDMSSMALDVWSDSDKTFVEEFVQLYWQREAKVRGGRVECCGVRIL
ncbi:uncharacterized protein AB675_4003 [Cyphellophora attinorum]|uniref:DUF4484 domain-containing protein n=1 Tax=Cyphellophora attinorum TaxID=1664694 RepID=A0A0N0NK15_9EURO|nr:uncharacterized protein AB675_4003 [Phialophora attinorum]KPI37621.1 hypothetical protein AB675_4003 [Phialophora attinorum]